MESRDVYAFGHTYILADMFTRAKPKFHNVQVRTLGHIILTQSPSPALLSPRLQTHMHAVMHTHACTCTHNMHSCMHARTHTGMCTHAIACVHPLTCAGMHKKDQYLPVHTSLFVCVCVHTHTKTMHTHTKRLVCTQVYILVSLYVYVRTYIQRDWTHTITCHLASTHSHPHPPITHPHTELIPCQSKNQM